MKLTMLKKVSLAAMAITVSVAMSGCVGGSGNNVQIDGVTGPEVEFVGTNVILSMVLNSVKIDGGAVLPIPKYPNSSLQVGPDFESEGTLLVLSISVTDFLSVDARVFPGQRLPDGRALPTVASGELPAIGIQIPSLFNTVLYIGPKVIGFFVPFQLKDVGGVMLSFRFHDKAGKPIGIMALVGAADASQISGFLAMMRTDLLGIIGKK